MKKSSKKISRAEKFGSLSEVSFSTCGYFCGMADVKFTLLHDGLRDDGNDLLLEIISRPIGWTPKEQNLNSKNPLEEDIDQPAQNIDQMMNLMAEIAGLKIEEWQRYYGNNSVLDGMSWKLVLRFNEGRTIIREGDNDYPENWDKFIEVLSHYTTVFNFLLNEE